MPGEWHIVVEIVGTRLSSRGKSVLWNVFARTVHPKRCHCRRNTLSGAASRKTSDPKLLKKALKRKAKKRAASTKAWRARLDQTKDAADKKQQIRAHNLGQRKLGGAAGANLSSKRIAEPEGEDGDKKEKRRRAGPHANRAGFEGKKNGFINGNGAGSGGGGGGGAPPAGGKGKQ